MTDRRSFIKTVAAVTAAAAAAPLAAGCKQQGSAAAQGGSAAAVVADQDSPLIVPKAQGLRITGTFLDEISHDIPHQNWGLAEWDADFRNMQAIGIDTVIMIRSGYRK